MQSRGGDGARIMLTSRECLKVSSNCKVKPVQEYNAPLRDLSIPRVFRTD